MKNLSQIFTIGLFVLGLTSLSACSSSQVEEGAPVETAGDASFDQPVEAATDAVPALDPSLEQKTPDALVTAAAESTPETDPSLDAPVTPLNDSTAQAPISDAPAIETPVADAPIIENAPVADLAPVVETPLVEPVLSSNSPSNDGMTYQVKKGDTLMKIAFEQYGDLYRWKEIYEANRGNIKDPNHVPPGTQLSLNGAGMVTIERNGETYLIKNGDTLGLISNDVYGTARKWKKLWENNRQLIKDPNRIYAGFYLYYVPEGKLTHEDMVPALKKEDSAMNAPKVSTAPREPASGTTMPESPAVTAPVKN